MSWTQYLRPIGEVLLCRSRETFCEVNGCLFCPRQSCLLDPSSRRYCDIQLVMVRPINPRKISPTPWFLSNGTSLPALFTLSCYGAMASIAFARATFTIVLDKSLVAPLWKVFFSSFVLIETRRPYPPWVLVAAFLMWMTLICSKIVGW